MSIRVALHHKAQYPHVFRLRPLASYLEAGERGPLRDAFLGEIARTPTPIVGFLVSLNQRV